MLKRYREIYPAVKAWQQETRFRQEETD